MRTVTRVCLLLALALSLPATHAQRTEPSGNACQLRQRSTIHLLAVGDVLLHGGLQRRMAQWPQGLLTALQEVQPWIRSADLALANLEGPAARDVAPGGGAVRAPATRFDGVVYSSYPLFNYHPAVIGELRQAGFRVLQTANNHSADRGPLGIDRSLEAIDAQGLFRTGTRHRHHRSRSMATVVPVHKDGQRHLLGFLACSYGTNGMPDPHQQVMLCDDPQGRFWAELAELTRRTDLSAVIALPHWGEEYQSRPNATQRQWAQRMVDAGVTAIIGTHPHVVQPIEWLSDAQGRQVAVAWSLGNFISQQVGRERLSAFMWVLSMSPDAQGRLRGVDMAWIPIRTDPSDSWRLRLLDDRGTGSTEDRLALQHLRATLPEAQRHPAALPLWSHRVCP